MAKRKNKEGTIYKKTVIRNGKEYTYWESQVSLGSDPGTGKRLRKTFTGATQREVRMKMQEASLAVENKEFFEPSRATLGQWIDKWLDQYCDEVKYQTIKHYRAQCETHIKPALGAAKLADLTTDQIQSFYKQLSKSGKTVTRKDKKTGKMIVEHYPLAPKSIKNIHSILSKCLNVAIELKYIKYNPATATKRPRVEKHEIVPLTDDQVRTFISSLDEEKYGDLYKVIIFTGLRKAEALGLTWDCVDFRTGNLKINKQMIRRPQKDGGYTLASVKSDKARTLTATPYVLAVLRHRQEEQDHHKALAGDNWEIFRNENGKKVDLVFTDEIGHPFSPKRVYLHYKNIAHALDADESRVHDLRHTYAVMSLQNGDDYKTLQTNLGHSSAAFTLDVYGHTSTRMQKESAARMQDFIDTLKQGEDDSKK